MDRQTDERTDGHGETSIPPYNFVAGDIKKDFEVKSFYKTIWHSYP
jgi:hypothetical protein